MPFFSVITCIYNSEKFLKQNLDSVGKQSFTDFEHLFVYSPSTDNSLKIIKKYCRQNPRAKIIYQPTSGISAAMNAGITAARGQYLVHLHSDDYFINPQVLSDIHKYITTHPEHDWLYGQIIPINAQSKPVGLFPKYWPMTKAFYPLLYLYNFIPHQSVFIKKSVFDKFGCFDSQYKYCMDYDFWLRIAPFTRFAFYPYPVSYYRLHDHAISSSPAGKIFSRQEYHRIQLKHFPWQKLLILFILFLILFFRLGSVITHLSAFTRTLQPIFTQPFADTDTKLTLKYPKYYPLIMSLRSQLPASISLSIIADPKSTLPSEIQNNLYQARLTQALLYPHRINYFPDFSSAPSGYLLIPQNQQLQLTIKP